MKEKNYDNYYIPDLIADLKSDALALKNKLELFEKLRRFFNIFSIVWSYVSIVLFTVYGIVHMVRTGDVILSSITFAVCGVFLIVNTVLLVLRDKSKNGKARHARAKRVFRVITVILRIAMTVIAIASLVGIADEPSTTLRVVWCAISMLWLGITVAIIVTSFIIRRVLRMLKEIAVERIRRTQAAFTNTAAVTAELVRTVKDIGTGIKSIFKNKNSSDAKRETDDETETDYTNQDDFFK